MCRTRGMRLRCGVSLVVSGITSCTCSRVCLAKLVMKRTPSLGPNHISKTGHLSVFQHPDV